MPMPRSGAQHQPNFGTLYMYTAKRSVRNNYQILLGDRSRCEVSFCTVDQEC